MDLLELLLQLNDPVIVISNFITDYENYDYMPTTFFRKSLSAFDPEKELYSILEMEAFNLKGVEQEYIVISHDTDYNRIWGEDNYRIYLSAYDIMAYYELPEENEVWSKYSIEGIDSFHVYINKMHFNSVTGGNGTLPITGGYSPKIGDVIRAKYNNFYYEIVDVNHTEQMFHQFKHCWDLILRPLKNEHINS